MIPLIKHTFTHPITHPETVALAIRHWPNPCMVKIIEPIKFEFDETYLMELLHYGIDFGLGGETIEEELEINKDGSVEIISSLRFPVLPNTIPINLKGIAV